MKINKIRLIESPKEEYSLAQSEMAALVGGATWYCPGTFVDGGNFGEDYCESSYSAKGQCGGATNYCGSYQSCPWSYDLP